MSESSSFGGGFKTKNSKKDAQTPKPKIAQKRYETVALDVMSSPSFEENRSEMNTLITFFKSKEGVAKLIVNVSKKLEEKEISEEMLNKNPELLGITLTAVGISKEIVDAIMRNEKLVRLMIKIIIEYIHQSSKKSFKNIAKGKGTKEDKKAVLAGRKFFGDNKFTRLMLEDSKDMGLDYRTTITTLATLGISHNVLITEAERFAMSHGISMKEMLDYQLYQEYEQQVEDLQRSGEIIREIIREIRSKDIEDFLQELQERFREEITGETDMTTYLKKYQDYIKDSVLCAVFYSLSPEEKKALSKMDGAGTKEEEEKAKKIIQKVVAQTNKLIRTKLNEILPGGVRAHLTPPVRTVYKRTVKLLQAA